MHFKEKDLLLEYILYIQKFQLKSHYSKQYFLKDNIFNILVLAALCLDSKLQCLWFANS